MGKSNLNSRELRKKQIGSHNFRYNCDSLDELKRRSLVKNKARQLGYADARHLELCDPETFAKVVKRCIPKPQKKSLVPLEVKRAIALLNLSKERSLRQLESLLGVGKSTIQRWCKELWDAIEKGVTCYVRDIPNPLQVVDDWVARSGSVPQFT